MRVKVFPDLGGAQALQLADAIEPEARGHRAAEGLRAGGAEARARAEVARKVAERVLEVARGK